MPAGSKTSLFSLLLAAALFAAFMCANLVVAPPPLRGASAAAQFDARAAQARLARILGPQVAHPIDSAAQDDVRTRLLREIEALGLKPEIHEAFACRPQTRGPLIDCGHVRNIVFSMGPQDAPAAILATSHYDSVPAGPGASDDGLGVSVWLEVAKEIAHDHLQRRVIFLITDGEEQALLGADYFGHNDPLMQSVTTLVDLEARGASGPAVFFESNEPNADAVNAYAAAPRPLANSIMADIYHFLPNSTDVSALTRPGLDVINIAVLDGVQNYHTPRDTIAAQDIRSVQHMGDQARAILERLAGAPDRNDGASLVYTDIASRFLIAMPSLPSHLLLALCALVALFTLWRAGKESRWSALAAPFAGLVLAAMLGLAVGLAFAFIEPGVDFWFAYPAATRAWTLALGLFGAIGAAALVAPRASPVQVEAAGFFAFALLGALTAIAAPGVSILFTLPMLFYAAGALVALAWAPARTIGAIAAALAALIIWAPVLYLTELALGYQLPFVSALLFALATLPWLGALARLKGAASWRLTWGSAAFAAVAGVTLAAILPASTIARPHYVNLLHFSNAVSGEQRILAGSAQRALPADLAHAYAFAPELIFPGDTHPYWATPAPAGATPTQGPVLEDVRIDTSGGQPTFRAHLLMNGAYRFVLRIPKAAKPQGLTMNGAAANFADVGEGPEPSDFVNVGCDGRSCNDTEIAITLAGEAQAGDWYIVGYYPALIDPVVSGAIPHRPDTATPIQNGDGAVTLSKVAF